MEPWEERVRQELDDLQIKTGRLAMFINNKRQPEFDIRQWELLKIQFTVMEAYVQILEARLRKD